VNFALLSFHPQSSILSSIPKCLFEGVVSIGQIGISLDKLSLIAKRKLLYRHIYLPPTTTSINLPAISLVKSRLASCNACLLSNGIGCRRFTRNLHACYHYEDNQCDDRDRIDSYGDGLCRDSSSSIPGVFKQFTEVKDENKVDFCGSWTEHGTQEISSCFVLACQKRVHNQRLMEEISLKLVRKKR
jgi:hypothetical protein